MTTSVAPPVTTLTSSTDIRASADRVWAIISDLPQMGAYSPENTGGRWRKGATGPALGAVFTGANRRGAHRWSTRVTVVTCEPGLAFAFDVTSVGLPVARWSYDITPTAEGCTRTETWENRSGALLATLGKLITGESDRVGFTAASLDHTLAAVKAHAEASA